MSCKVKIKGHDTLTQYESTKYDTTSLTYDIWDCSSLITANKIGEEANHYHSAVGYLHDRANNVTVTEINVIILL